MSALHNAPDETAIPPCVEDPALFHAPEPEREAGAARQDREAAAKALCARCELRDWCIATAGDDDESIRGGLTYEERTGRPRRSKRKHAPAEPVAKEPKVVERDARTWDDCGGYAARTRHRVRQIRDCRACVDFSNAKSREQRARRRAEREALKEAAA